MYNGNLSKSTQLQTAYIKAVGNQNHALGNYLAGLNGANASMGGYIKSLIGAKAATIGLQVASVALNATITMGISLAISALVTQIQKWANAQEDARKKSVELTNSYKEQQSSLESQIEKYKELKDTLDDGNLSTDEARSIKEQLLEIQQSLIESYGDEASNIDLVNGKYREQLGLLGELSKEKATEYVTENRDVFADAKEALEKERTYNLGTVTSWNDYSPQTEDQKKLLDYIEAYSELLDLTYTGATGRGVSATSVSVSVKADVASADELMHQFATDLEKYGQENDIDVSGILEGISGQLKETWTDELTEYKTVYDEFMKAEIVRNDTLRPLYQESIQAVEDYNKALSTGEGIEEAKANLESVQQSVQSATGELEGSQGVFDGIYEGINKDAEAAYNLGKAFENDKTVQNYAEQLRGLTDIDLKAINFNNDNTEKGEEAFKGLMETLGLTEEQVQSLINKLVELGYVQGEVQGSTSDNEITVSNVFALEDANNNATALSDYKDQLLAIENAYQTCLSAKEEYEKQGYLSIDTLQKVLSLGDEYLQYLFDEQGNVKLDAEAFKQLSLARINDMEAQALSNLAQNIQQITDEATATEYLTSKQNKLATSYGDVAANALLAMTTISGFSDSEALQGVYSSFKAQYNQIKSLFASTRKGLDSTYARISDSAKKDAETALKEAQEKSKSYIESYMNFQNQSLEKGQIDYNTYCNSVSNLLKSMYKDGKISAQDYYDYVGQMLEEQKSIYDKALSAILRRYDKEIDRINDVIDGIEKQNDALEKQKDEYDSILSAIQEVISAKKESYETDIENIEAENDSIQEQIDNYDFLLNAVTDVFDEKRNVVQAEIDLLQERIDKLQEANDEESKAIALEKAKYELERAMNQRTKLVYTKEKGFIYKTDEEAIRDSKQNVKDLEFEATIEALEKEKDLLADIIEQLDEAEESWSKISDTFDKNKRQSIAESIFGKDYKDIILQSNPEVINDIMQSYMEGQQKLEDNQSLIESINEKIDNLDKLADKWDSIAGEREKITNHELAIEKFGAEWENVILDGRLDAFDEFKAKYLSIQDQINDNTSLINSYEEKITYYENLKSQWSVISDVYENSIEDQYAAMLMGQNWESDILSGRIDTLNNFKNNYISIQQAIADAAWNSTKEQINAAKEAQKAASGKVGSANVVSGFNNNNATILPVGIIGGAATASSNSLQSKLKSEYQQKINDTESKLSQARNDLQNAHDNTSRVDKQKLVNYYEDLLKDYKIKYNKYAGGTTNAKGGLHLVSEREYGDEIIIKNDNSAVVAYGEQLYPFEGGETVIKASETEKILSNTGNFIPLEGITFDKSENAVHFTQEDFAKRLQSVMPNYASMVQIPNIQIPKCDFAVTRNETTPVVQNISLTLPNVTNDSGYERLKKELRQMQIDAYQFAHRR